MTKAEMKEMVKNCIEQRNLLRVFFLYDENFWCYFPLVSNDKLFLGAEEDDFIIDGYSIRRFVDVSKVQVNGNMCIKILKAEGIIDSIKTPNVDITNWETVFTSLQKMNINVIVENESLNEDECEFTIGKIDRVFKKCVYIYHFDAEGIWDDEPYRIPYTEITSVSFGTRYVETFSKYLSESP